MIVEKDGARVGMAGPEKANGNEMSIKEPARGYESLDYLCGLISELKDLADRAGQKTLSAILTAALTEANIQRNAARHS
ncbi:MAG TPA: hypothetical protein VFF87_05845 [Hyphomicrobium sp.]|nr:hypothetical protein [Hyphomicrobium sp.]